MGAGTATGAARQQDPGALVERAAAGDRAALARLISLIERGGPAGRAVGRATFPLGGSAYTIGVTGAPGAGKSTLVSRMIAHLRASQAEVGVLAVDPSSPFSGGALLGDRVRMQDHALDPGVFIRSMATRGHLGGLALAVPEAVRALDAAGLQWVLLETVGVGQVEVEVAGSADTTLVVVNPGSGDGVQANKAGLLEIADVFVINKADRPGVKELRRDLDLMLDLSAPAGWRPPIVPVVAATGEGLADAWTAVERHRAHLAGSGELEARRQSRIEAEVAEIVARVLEERARAASGAPEMEELRSQLAERRIGPYEAAERLLARIGRG